MCDAAKERKRERERALLQGDKAKARMRRANKVRSQKEKEITFIKNIGAFCVIHWFKCQQCSRLKYFKNKEYKSAICGICIRANKNIGRKIVVKPKVVACMDCGTEHMALATNIRCQPCRERRAALARQRHRMRYGKSIRDRVRRFGCHYQPVNKEKVYKRDKYKCYMCGVKVVVCDGYQPNMATLDHIVPLASGGSHTYDNVRTCCAMCNSVKRNTVRQGTQIGLFCVAVEAATGQP